MICASHFTNTNITTKAANTRKKFIKKKFDLSSKPSHNPDSIPDFNIQPKVFLDKLIIDGNIVTTDSLKYEFNILKNYRYG